MTAKFRLPIVLGATLALLQQFTSGSWPIAIASAHAQGPVQIKGVPVTATRSATVSFAELARQDALRRKVAEPAMGVTIPFNSHVEPADAPKPQARPPILPPQPSVASPAPSINYIGLDDIARAGTGIYNIPPDTMGAVGHTRVLDTLNNNYRVQEKSTGATVGTTNIETFWAGTGATGLFDPVTRYDPYNNRFIVAATSNAHSATSSIVVGVSTGTDPNGTYNLFRFQACSAGNPCGAGVTDWWADYPTVGFNKNWVAISVNMFGTADGVFKETRVLVLNYPNLLANVFSSQLFTGIADFTVQPCVTYSSTENTLYAPNHINSVAASYRLNTLTGTAAAPVFTSGASKNHTLAPLSGGWSQPTGNSLPQAAGTAGAGDVAKVHSSDARIINCVFRNNNIWYAQGVKLPAVAPTHDAVQWVKLDTAGNDADGGRVEDATATDINGGKWYSRPSIAVNKFNDALLGFSQFASNQWPSAAYAYRAGGDAAGTMRVPVIYKAGEGMYWKTFDCTNAAARNRWGDYSNTQVDPSDDTSLWTLQEYSKPEGSPFAATGCNSGVWSTWWAQVVPYTVTYVGNGNNGGSVPVDGNSYLTGSLVTVLGNTGVLVKTGYIFEGWNTQADGLGTNYVGGATFSMPSANVTLFARWVSSNADLSGLTISAGTLSPGFSSGTTSYTDAVSNATASVTVTPTLSDATATIKVNTVTVASGSASGPIALVVGSSNVINVVVTAQDGATTKTYTITVTRAGSANANLSALTISAGTLTPGFASGTTSYTDSVSNATTSVTVTPTLSDATATIKVNTVTVASGSASGPIALVVGSSNVINVVVTAQDLSTKTYTITVARAAGIDLAIGMTHNGNFARGNAGATYTIMVSNVGGTSTNGSLASVTDTLGVGLTATALSGSGWACLLGTLTCTRSDVLGEGGSYPAITLTVSVASNAPGSVQNSATVSGGGDTNAANNTVTDTARTVPGLLAPVYLLLD